MSEQEEFEFRLRLEREREATAPVAARGDATTAEKIAADPLMRFAVGAAKPIQGAVQRMSEKGFGTAFPALSFIAKMARPQLDEAFAETAKMSRSLLGGDEGTDVAGLVGSMASPASLGLSKVGVPASVLGKMASGVGAGAGGGMLAPAANQDEARQNAMYGAAAGGVLTPLAALGAKAADVVSNSFVRPMSDLFTKQGPANILNRYIRGDKVVGEQGLPAVIAATRNAKAILPGGKPTVADVTAALPDGSPLSALQNISAKTGGGISARYAQRALDQEAAIEAATAARTAASTVNYAKAFDTALNKVKGDPELAVLAKNPFFKDEVPTALKLAQAKGLTPKDNLTEVLHDIKTGLDRKLKAGPGDEALSASKYAEILNVKKQLVDWLAKKNKDYDFGRAEHAKASRLIDEYIMRQKLAKDPLQPTSLHGGINIGEETRPHLPNLLSRPAMALNWAMRKAGGGVEPKVDKLLADMMLDPAKFADEMSRASPKTLIDVEKWLQRSNALAAGIGQAQ